MKILSIVITFVLLAGCSTHTENVWSDGKISHQINRNTIRVSFITNREIAVWVPSGTNSIAQNYSGLSLDEMFVKYETDEDISETHEGVRSLQKTDHLQCDKYKNTLTVLSSNVRININGKTISARPIGCGITSPNTHSMEIRSNKIQFDRRIDILERSNKYDSVGEKIIVTPVAVALDAVDTTIATASIPIWLPILLLISSGGQGVH